MSSALLTRLDTLAAWRRSLDRGMSQLLDLLVDIGLVDAQAESAVASVRQRLASDRLVLAFVAEFSRGKSELINAMFFADTGRRVLPATPGRTTMCPVEIAWDGQQVPSLSLLPIDTRLGGQSLALLRELPQAWRSVPLPVQDADAMAQVLQQVMQTQRVSLDQARALGFWDDEHPEDNPPRDEHDMVEVPSWRHALINYPHPLLKRGLVVVDTPGLNAIGAEPELTLALLPSAHATVFLLAADTGVTRSDLAVWRDHLGDRGCERFVVLNKIDTLADPLLKPAQIQAQVQSQCVAVATTLGVPEDRVFALSARQALFARVRKDAAALERSRLPALEQALLLHLLPQRRQVIGSMVEDGVLAVQQTALGRLSDRQRQVAEQLAELRGLRGKSAGRLKLMSNRLDAEATEFERCGPRLTALRVVLAKQQQTVLDVLSSDQVRRAVGRMREEAGAGWFNRGAARSLTKLVQALNNALARAVQQCREIEQMLQASGRSINAEFGFSLTTATPPSLERYAHELERIEAGYGRYLGVTQLWRRSKAGFMERFSEMLLSRLRVVFESAANDIEQWAKAMGTQIDDQLRERRQSLQQRRDAHSRIRAAEDGLEFSIQDLEAREARTQRQIENLAKAVDKLRILAASPPPAVELDLEEGSDETTTAPVRSGEFAEADLADMQTKAEHVQPAVDAQTTRSRRAKSTGKPAPAHGTAA
jgi:hypothetical protein